MMKAYSIIIVLLLLFMTSCVTNNDRNKESQWVVDRLTFSNSKDAPLEGIDYKSFNIIALETSDECLLRDIVEVRPYLSYLYVLDGNGALFIFDTNGNYINQVGKKGNGPDEYIKLTSFLINKKDQSIAIIDDFKNKIFNYDLSGNHIKSNSINPSIKYSKYSVMAKDGNILLNYLINFGDNEAFSIIDGEDYDKNVYLKSYAPIEVKGYLYSFSNNPMTETKDGNINFIMPLCDTIFEYSNRQYYPKYVVDIPNKMVDRELFKTNTTDKGATYPSMLFKYGNDGLFTGFTGIFETNNHILLKYRYNGIVSGVYLANKESLEGNYYLCSIPENPVKVPLRNIIGSNDHEFIDAYNATDLIALYNKYNKNTKDETLNKLKNTVEVLDEESNPCLIFYSFE